MRLATLGILVQDGKILLGEKKRGEIGTGILSGPGGKIENGETPIECLVRETLEELGITLFPDFLELVAIIDFYAADTIDFRVYVYRTDVFSGELKETDDMIPGWYTLDAQTYERMFDADRRWFPKAIRGEKFIAEVYYRERAKGFLRIEPDVFM